MAVTRRDWMLVWALLLLLWCSIATTLPNLKLADDVSPSERRFSVLRSWIPKDTTVQLLTNVPATDVSLLNHEHFIAQYALAPAIVVRDQERPYVVVDLYGNLPPLAPEALAGCKRVVDLGNGVALYRRPAP